MPQETADIGRTPVTVRVSSPEASTSAATSSPPRTSEDLSPVTEAPTPPRSEGNLRASPVSDPEMQKVRLLLQPMLERAARELYPDVRSPSPRFTSQAAHSIAFRDGDLIALPMRAVFVPPQYAHCWLAVVRLDSQTVHIVPMPEGDDHPECRSMEVGPIIDFNADGIPDWAFRVEIPSNRYHANVAEARVFLSDPSHETYCYAPALGAYAGEPIVFRRGAAAIQDAVRAAASRIGPSVYACAPADSVDPRLP